MHNTFIISPSISRLDYLVLLYSCLPTRKVSAPYVTTRSGHCLHIFLSLGVAYISYFEVFPECCPPHTYSQPDFFILVGFRTNTFEGNHIPCSVVP